MENEYKEMTKTQCGTPKYMSPQILRKEPYSYKTDVFSIGTAFYELLMGHCPFIGYTPKEILKNLTMGLYFIPSQLKLTVECINILSGCLQFDESQRFSVSEIMEHAYLKDDFEYNNVAYHGVKMQQKLWNLLKKEEQRFEDPCIA